MNKLLGHIGKVTFSRSNSSYMADPRFEYSKARTHFASKKSEGRVTWVYFGPHAG